jgi:predicted ATPase/DNA-binding CsgD family transcriptional regulator
MASYPNNLPLQLSHFIGREQAIVDIKRAVWTTRLLTLTGPGGCGKTRLALTVAEQLLDAFQDGVWLIELAALSDAALLPRVIMSALDMYEQTGHTLSAALIEQLRPRELLLVLDNCEHLIDGCADLALVVLQQCPDLKILATSSEALNITGEIAWPVPPLSMINPQQITNTATLQTSEAARLFLDRAAAARPDFAVSDRAAPAIAQICRRLDGLPLAIELAAARVKVLAIDQIAVRLDDRFNLLSLGERIAPDRHQTLRAMIDWSYGLLEQSEKTLFRRLAVFAGGWTLEAAQAVCGSDDLGPQVVLDVLTRLIDKSLVQVRKCDGETRCSMLETIRHYASEKLLEANELEGIRRRHLDCFVKLAEESEPQLQGPEQARWIERLDTENGNLRAALEWSLTDGDVKAGLRLAVGLGQYWFMRGHLFGEGREWLEKILSRPEAQEQKAARARAFLSLGTLTYFQGDHGAAHSAYENSLTLNQELRNKDGIAESLYYLADVAAIQGDGVAARALYAAARSASEENLAGLRAQGDQWNIARTLNFLGELTRTEGNYLAARSLYEESLAIRRELGDQRGTAVSLINLGFVAHYQGDYRQAARVFAESLALFQKHGGRRGIVDCIAGLAGVAGAEGQSERAAQLFGAVEALREVIRTYVTHADQIEYDRNVAAVHAQLDAATFTRAWAEGRTLTMEEAVDFALAVAKSSPVDKSSAVPVASRRAVKQRVTGLTAREREVAALVAQGKANREIGEALVVELKTVEAHITHILSKLGFDNRVQIATWAMNHGLASPITPDV